LKQYTSMAVSKKRNILLASCKQATPTACQFVLLIASTVKDSQFYKLLHSCEGKIQIVVLDLTPMTYIPSLTIGFPVNLT
jgi:hypothetical protein